jgi:DNA-binding transcriptional ArsR family regulator
MTSRRQCSQLTNFTFKWHRVGMAQPTVRLVEDADGLRAALGPLRRAVLERLREAASATEVAAALGVPRQRVNYHVRALEQAGLVELVEERRRRGCIERIMRATAQAFVVDPEVLGAPTSPTARVRARDRFAAEHLMATAATTVRDVGRMVTAAGSQDKRLLTFTVEAQLRFAQPADVHRFTAAAAEAIARTAEQYTTPGAGRAYRVVLGGYPAPARSADIQQGGTHREHDSA